MAQILAILTDDPSLLRCQLHRIRGALALKEGEPIGVGSYSDGDVLLASHPAEKGPRELASLAAGIRSPALLAASRRQAGFYEEEAIDPFRFHSWLFAMSGGVEGFDELRGTLLEKVPPFIARQVRGVTDREHVFALFLRELHAVGALDDPALTAGEAARCLSKAIRALDALCGENGRTRPAPLAAVVMNGRSMAAVRRGRPLSYGLLEGMSACEICGLEEGERDEPRRRVHRRAKAVALLTEPAAADGFIEVPDGSTVAVGRGLDIAVASLAP
ncbi:MAG TPA: class II glutamine amidotransferase [Vulgatibacter sp.]|nr:class II glutamine amidotransferase [Vulgatibacter sp.]